MASTQGASFNFNEGAGIDFTAFGMEPVAFDGFKGTSGEGNTSSFFFADEGIDTTSTSFNHSFDSMFVPVGDINSTAFGMEPLGLDNTAGSVSWDTAFPPTPVQSFESLYTPQYSSMSKRPLSLDVHDYPPAKRHEAFSPFSTSASITASSSNWALDTQPTPAASSDVGLSDEAADVCATWFSKYNVLPSDRHIDSLSQLTGESATAIRQWFGQALKQGMNGQDSAYKSQTGFTQDALLNTLAQTTPAISSEPLTISDLSCNHDTQAVTTASPLRGGKKGCNPTDDPELLKRDPNKIYQCTRKCGKRYGRKCDWKRNEEEGYPSKSWTCSLCISEGVERVKPCFRKYHFSQHFRNIHPGLNAADYEETSVVHSDNSLPQAARKCGFCVHQFASRQDRIDHIAEHFKDGKCMLDWNDEDESDNNDSDNMDDDDDRPDSGGGFGNGKDFLPPNDKPRDPCEKRPNNDNGNGGDGSSDGPQSGFFQFQVSQFNKGQISESQICIEDDNRHIQSIADQSIQRSLGPDAKKQDLHGTTTTAESGESTCSKLDGQCSLQGSDYLHGRNVETERNNSQTLAGDVVSLATDCGTLQVIPQSVPPCDGDPTQDESGRIDSNEGAGDGIKSGVLTLQTISDHLKSPALSRETESLLGSLKLLGTGGFSTVDEVVHRETSLRFARKTLKNRERSALEELKNEVSVLQKLRHPHIVRFVDSVQKGDRMSILLAPVAETTLASWLDTNMTDRPRGLTQTIVNMFGCLASSIRYLHEQRPVVKHMDIKPQNILVMQGSQEFPHVILSDFGVSSIGELSASDKTMPLTRQYCAPEVSEGTSREIASDIWSLGCVFVEMATVAFSEDNPHWLNFRKQFGGRKGKYYWQDVKTLHGLLTQSLDHAGTTKEADVARTVKTMLSLQPSDRPTAPQLSMLFTPAPCCLSWPNEHAAYPDSKEELQQVKTLIQHQDGVDIHVGDVQGTLQSDNTAHAKRWLHSCSHGHEACHFASTPGKKTLPTRLIDLQPQGGLDDSIRLVDGAKLDVAADGDIDYAAVSYLWSDEETKLLTGNLAALQSALAREQLSTALNEAIAKVQDVGLRYIWVDSLCVLQDSEEDRKHECQATADVYRNAALTIVLDQLHESQHSSGHSRQTSTSTQEQQQQLSSKNKGDQQATGLSATLPLATYLTPGFAWDTRAWSLQERLLSRRFLHVTHEQLYWECNSLKASETFPHGLDAFRSALSSLLWEKVHMLDVNKLTVRKIDGTGTGGVIVTGATAHAGARDNCKCSGLDQQKKRIPLGVDDLRDCQYVNDEGDGVHTTGCHGNKVDDALQAQPRGEQDSNDGRGKGSGTCLPVAPIWRGTKP